MFEDDDELQQLEPEVNEEEVQIDDVSDHPDEEQETQDEDKIDSFKERQKRTQKRIDKLVYERNIEREARAKETAELRAEIEALKQERLKEREERDTSNLDAKRQELLQRKKDALEIGDHDEVVKIDDELFDIKFKVQRQPREQEEPPRQQANQTTQPNTANINTALAAWQQGNAWVFDPQQKSRLEKANKVMAEMIDDGYDFEDPDTYAQLDKRLKRVAPPPTAAPDRGQAVGSNRSTAFTASDKAMMREFGLDPDNETHRKEWIRNKGK